MLSGAILADEVEGLLRRVASVHGVQRIENRLEVHNEVLGWQTEPGSAVQHAGMVRFQASCDGGTRVTIRLTYNPDVGGLGHAFATSPGADPKTQMDGNLVRMKTFIEAGKVPSDAAAGQRSPHLHRDQS